MVCTTVIPLNFRWFPPQLEFPVVVYEIHCRTNGSLFFLHILPTDRLKKNNLHYFPNTYAWTDLHNCLNVYRDQSIYASALHDVELGAALDYMSMYLCLSIVSVSSCRFKTIMSAPTNPPNYSCLVPPTFSGLTDIEDFLTQFDAVASLS